VTNSLPNVLFFVLNHQLTCNLLYTSADCSPSFEFCTGITTTVTFQHSSTLDAAEATYQLYDLADLVANHVLNSLTRSITFVGNASVSATIKFVLNGVPPSSSLNAAQFNYFADYVKEFINDLQVVPDILDIQIDGQTPLRMRNLQDSGSSLELTGTVRGFLFYYSEANEFSNPIHKAFVDNTQKLVDQLVFDAGMPHNSLKEEEAGVFLEVTSITGELEPIDRDYTPPVFWNTIAPTPTPPKEDGLGVETGKTIDKIKDNLLGETEDLDSNKWMIVGVVAAAVIVLCCLVIVGLMMLLIVGVAARNGML